MWCFKMDIFLLTLVVFLPQALVAKSTKKLLTRKSGNSSKYEGQNQLNDNIISVNLNDSTKIKKVSDIQSVFMNPSCKACHNCMEDAVLVHKAHLSNNGNENSPVKIHYELKYPEEKTTHRNKRNLDPDTEPKTQDVTKKSKTKKRKAHKFNVIKYNEGDKIYALKIKEPASQLLSDEQNSKASQTKCQVYSVRDSFPCDTPDANLILKDTKTRRKVNKVDNKEQKENKQTEKDSIIAPLFIKHHMDDSLASENFMPSIEEMY